MEAKCKIEKNFASRPFEPDDSFYESGLEALSNGLGSSHQTSLSKRHWTLETVDNFSNIPGCGGSP